MKSRGLEVTNDDIAFEYLRRIGYYRLSGYYYPFRERTASTIEDSAITSPRRKDTFISGAKFQDAVELYVFDKKLRLLVLDAIERIEVAFRVDIAYLLGAKDPFAYTKPDLLHGNFAKKIDSKTNQTKHQEWLTKHAHLVSRSREDFIMHYKSKYDLPLPIWIAIELWDFGLLSTFYKGMAVADKSVIAAKYDIPDWRIMESWLRCLNFVRNVAAHHSRMWNKNLIDQPKLPKRGEMTTFDGLLNNKYSKTRIYIALYILKHFMSYVCPRSSWPSRLYDLIHSFPNKLHLVSIKDMGFPLDWGQQVFWRDGV